MDGIIRPAREDDIPMLARFEREISIISFGDEAVTDLDFHAKKIRSGLEKDGGGLFVLEAGGKISGWLWMDTKVNYVTKEKYANFRSFYIDEAWRGGAESEALLQQGLEYCRQMNARSVVGKVHAGNLAMRALYKQAGFTATHITMEYHF